MTPALVRLAARLADLKARVRAALASELAGHVAAAVRDVVHALIDRRAVPHHGPSDQPSRRPWNREPDPWDDTDPDDRYRIGDHDEYDPPTPTEPTRGPTPTAVAVGVRVGQWCLGRRWGLLAAVAGIAAGLFALVGGPLARAALAALAATADLLTAADLLGGRT